jgi:magnesium transporter
MTKKEHIPKRIQEIRIDNPQSSGYALRWINVVNASRQEINYFKKKFGFSDDHLQASVSTAIAQRPLVEVRDGYVFIILHFPTFQGEKVVPGEIEFFIGHGYLITLHNNNLKPLNNFFAYCQEHPEELLAFQTESSSTLLYELLNRLIKDTYIILDHNSVNISETEEIIFYGKPKEAAGKILNLRRNIINIRKITKNHATIMQSLQDMKSNLVPRESIQKHYEDLEEHSRQIWDFLDMQRELVEALHDTNESLLNNKMNDIMMMLTIFSVLLLPLTLITGIFGMNTINMPLVTSPGGFWIIIAIMVASLLALLSIFKRNKWL